MPANVYNYINNLQNGRRETPTQSSTGTVPNTQGNPVNTKPYSDGTVHEATIVEPPKESTVRQPKLGKRSAPKHGLGVRVGMSVIDHVLNETEQQNGLSGLGKVLAPHLHEIIQDSPLKNVPDSIVGLAGRFLLNQLKKG